MCDCGVLDFLHTSLRFFGCRVRLKRQRQPQSVTFFFAGNFGATLCYLNSSRASALSEGFFAQTDFGDVGSQPTRYCGPFFSAADDRSRPHDQLQGAFAPSGYPNLFFSAGSAGRRRGDAVAFAAIDLVRPGAAGMAHRVDKARKLLFNCLVGPSTRYTARAYWAWLLWTRLRLLRWGSASSWPQCCNGGRLGCRC